MPWPSQSGPAAPGGGARWGGAGRRQSYWEGGSQASAGGCPLPGALGRPTPPTACAAPRSPSRLLPQQALPSRVAALGGRCSPPPPARESSNISPTSRHWPRAYAIPVTRSRRAMLSLTLPAVANGSPRGRLPAFTLQRTRLPACASQASTSPALRPLRCELF